MQFPPQTLPSTDDYPSLLRPGTSVFARRASRLRTLAGTSPAADWLNRLALLCEAQQTAFDALGDLGLRLPAGFDWQQAAAAGRQKEIEAAWPAIYPQLAGAMAAAGVAVADLESAQASLPAVRALLEGEAEAALRAPTEAVLAAALQVVWTRFAQGLDVPAGKVLLAERGHCPCCGSLPLGSIVFAGQGRGGARYQECSLCATRWNAVRARCTLCDDPGVVAYLGIEDAFPAVRAEACEHCKGYSKLYFQDKDLAVDPLADDLASLALDVLVGEQGYARGGPNPFLLLGGNAEPD